MSERDFERVIELEREKEEDDESNKVEIGTEGGEGWKKEERVVLGCHVLFHVSLSPNGIPFAYYLSLRDMLPPPTLPFSHVTSPHHTFLHSIFFKKIILCKFILLMIHVFIFLLLQSYR